jgi:hypothetical protein
MEFPNIAQTSLSIAAGVVFIERPPGAKAHLKI